jgi:hypothetical protein
LLFAGAVSRGLENQPTKHGSEFSELSEFFLGTIRDSGPKP